MDRRIRDLLDARPKGKAPDLDAVEKWLGAPLALDRDGPWRIYKGPIARAPFVKADARFPKAGGKAFVVLETGGEPVFEKDLGLVALGMPANIDQNPRIPPEGTIAYLYRLDGQKVWFTFGHGSHRLLSISVAWGE
jgi:hypothetical protein